MKYLVEYSFLTFIVSYFYALDKFESDEVKLYADLHSITHLGILYEQTHEDCFINLDLESINFAEDVTEGNVIRHNNLVICKNKNIKYYKPFIVPALVEWFKTLYNKTY